jgi:hypothetical protein
MTIRQTTEFTAESLHFSSWRRARGISAVNTPLPSPHWDPARGLPAALMPNLEGPAQVHLTVTDEAFPADRGSVTPPAPWPEPVYSVFVPTGSGDWTGSGRRSGLVGVPTGEGVAPGSVDAFAGADAPRWPAVARGWSLPEQADTSTRADRPTASRGSFIRSSSTHEWAM